ncbi:phage terminase small subunit [Celerinatantimonas sp. MCCC 1A17872]|uniref:phage terminase small subunit n=1 Tax=Celerinatantimonas sp. MCCC 1A17872 TaxID=3177514 RepID=UPI0038CA9E8A
MLSLAQRHQRRQQAAKAANTNAPQMAGATAYELQLMQLKQDQLRLKQIQSSQGKAKLKTKLLPAYTPYIDGVLQSGTGAQDDIVTTIMLWQMDAANYARALQIGAYVLKFNLKMPDRFARTSACVIAEELSDAALAKLKQNEPFERALLEQTQTLTNGHDMPDEVRAKVHLALGKQWLFEATTDEQNPDNTQLEHAQSELKAAIDLHNRCGGKKDLERVERLLKRTAD